jgi:sigma-B regulation protein RsbU (phosphoserine phosphatase)
MSTDALVTLANFLAGGFLIFLAITVTRDNFTNRLNRITGGMLLFAGLGPIFLALGSIIEQPAIGQTQFQNSLLYQIHTVWELFFPCLLLFALLFPVDRLRELRYARLRTLLFLPQIMHLIVVVFFSDINSMLEAVKVDPSREGFSSLLLKPFSVLFTYVLYLIGVVRTYESVIFDVVNLIYIAIAFYFLETGARYLKEPRLQSQTKFVLWAIRVALGLYAVATLATLLASRHVPPAVMTTAILLSILGGTIILAFAIIRYQFLDVQLVFRQSFIYTITSGLLVGGYIVMGVRAKEFMTPIFGDRAEMISYIFLIFILMLFQPISTWLDNVIRSMFMRTRSDYRNVIERFSRQVISMFDPRLLRQTIDETLKTALLVDKVYFVLYDDSVGEYALLESEDNQGKIIIERDDLMLRGINLLDVPTGLGSLEKYETGSKLAALLKERKIKLVLPMKDSKHLLGFLALTNKAAGYSYSAEDFNLLGVLSNQMVSALTNARLYVESMERMRLQEEVNMARQIQLDLLPSAPPILTCSKIFAQSIPSRTVGGDFYDFIQIEGTDRWGVVIADASGKGMPAALMMAQIQAIIRSEVSNGHAISDMLFNINRQIATSSSAEKYVTLFYGELNTKTSTFTYSNAGHNYPLLVRTNGDLELLIDGGPVIGAFPHLVFTSSSVQLNPGDMLFLFTDGLSEAMNADDQEYGEERIRKFVQERRQSEPEALVQAILDDVRLFDPSIPPQDDTTIIAIQMLANGSQPHGR